MEKPGQLASTEKTPCEEERSQWELEKRIFHLKTLYDVSQVIGSLRDSQSIIRDLVMMVMGTFGALRGIILLADMQKNQLEAVAYRGLDKSSQDLLPQIFTPETFQEMKGIGAIQILAAEPEVDKDGRKSFFSLLSTLQLRIWVPFAINEHFKGGIGLGEKLSGEMYSADDQELLSTLANQLTVALDNVLAYKEIEQLNRGLEEKVRQRTEELQQEHEKLKEANQQLEVRNRFIRATFGRYLSDEVVASLLESPEGLALGGKSARPHC